jgi:hypothetical protein
VSDERERRPPPAPVSFAKLAGASVLVTALVAVLCLVAWWIARWLKL